jgi:polyisoprenoid-binding protein YceI
MLLACSQPSPTPSASPFAPPIASTPSPLKFDAPAGSYAIDPAHTSLIFRVSHLGFSNFTARFARVDATLQIDPANPAAAQLEATVDPKSIETDNAPEGFLAMLRGKDWLDAKAYPQITFRSTRIEMTAPNAARVIGDFTLHGQTRPLTLDVAFNGGYAGHPMEPHARIGFSARGAFKRSDFGVAAGLPAPGTTMGVGDGVDVIIETELTGPPWRGPAPAPEVKP